MRNIKNALSWLVKNWKAVLLVIGTVLGIVVVRKLIAEIVGSVSKPTTWQPVPGDKTSIFVKDGTKWVQHQLPDGVTSDKVKAAGITQGGKAEVEIAHGITDRRAALDSGAGNG